MPRAFLMQYKKKPKVNVIYQEADTTEARQMTPGNGDQNQTCISASKPIQTGSRHDPTLGMTEIIERNRSQISDELMEDEEISVTDSEDEKVIQNRGGYDDSGCHEEDFQEEDDTEEEDDDEEEEDEDDESDDDDKGDEEGMQEDEEDEEINVGDNEFGHLENHQTFLYNQYQNYINQQQQQTLASPSLSEEESHVKLDDRTYGDNNPKEDKRDDKIGNKPEGKHHSAFRKPPGQIRNEMYHHFHNGQTTNGSLPDKFHMMYGPEFRSYMDARHHQMTNYWLYMSKLYHGHMPPLPPYTLQQPPTSSSLPAMPLDPHGAHLEALHKQMLHHNMLYIKSQGRDMVAPVPPSVPMYLEQHLHAPKMPHHAQVSPRQMVSSPPNSENSDARSDSSPSSSRDKKCTSPPFTRRRSPETSNNHNNRLKREPSKDRSGNISPSDQQNSAMRSTAVQLPNHPHLPLGMPYSYPPPPIHPGQEPPPSLHPLTSPLMTSPSHMTSSRTSSISPTSSFGTSPMNPYLYQGILGYGTRRPRDPNKPPPVKKYKCDICSKAFSRSNTLVTHRRIHTGEKPFKCEVCSRAFRQPGNLTRHRLTHTTVKPYVCVVCKKAFNRASNLHTHMRTHSNFRPFLCPYCGKSFQQKVDLKIHMYTHGGAPPMQG